MSVFIVITYRLFFGICISDNKARTRRFALFLATARFTTDFETITE